jgi:protein-disulfide isomerase
MIGREAMKMNCIAISNKLHRKSGPSRSGQAAWFLLMAGAAFVYLTPIGVAQQSRTANPSRASNGSPNSSVKPQVGISREQADAILTELRQIRRLLEQQQEASSAPPATQSEKVQISVATDWHVTGSDQAPVTIVEFTDLQCTFCRRFHVETYPMIKKNYIDAGKVRFVSRDMPLEFHQHALKAAEATRCAGEQDKFWEMRNAILESMVPPSEDYILNLAKNFMLNPAAFRACLDSERYKPAIQKDTDEATALHISGTPTFVVARTTKDTLDGVRMVGALSYLEFQLKIDGLLNQR